MAVSIERAIQSALQRHLELTLGNVTVWDHWPDASAPLPDRCVSIIRVPARRDELLQPEVAATENVHDTMPTRVTAGVVVDVLTAVVALNDVKATWNAHCASTDSHRAADAAHLITSADAFDLATAIALANEARGDFNLHAGSGTYHDVGDSKNRITAVEAFDLPSLVTLAEQLRTRVNAHYAARYYHWRIRACELPLQLDVWGKYEKFRDEILADLEPALNVDATPARLDGGDPVRNGVLLSLQDGWEHTVADVLFDAPSLEDSEDAALTGTWRATYRGTADFNLLVRAQSARLARVVFRTTVYEASVVGADIVTTTEP